MGLNGYLKNFIEIIEDREKKIVGAAWDLPKYHSQIGLNWLCHLAGKTQTALKISFFLLEYFFLNSLDMRPLRPMPSHFCHI